MVLTSTATVPVLVFPLKHLSLALRLEWVIKVIPLPEIFGSGQKAMGVAHFEDREITILDPYRQLYGVPNPAPFRYVVVVQPTSGNDYGIPVTTLPVFQELPLKSLRSLPSSYRQGDTLGIASHVALIPTHPDQTQTIFLLDVEALWEAIAGTGVAPDKARISA